MAINLTTICGVPVHVDRAGDVTVIRPQMREGFSPIQSRLVSGWLEHRGNSVQIQSNTITVRGPLQPGSLANVGK